MSISQNKLMTLREACEFLQCSQSFLYKIARSGDLKAIKIGNCWRFKPEDVEDWVIRKRDEKLTE